MFRSCIVCLSFLLVLVQPAFALELTAWSPQGEDHPTTLALQSFLAQIKEADNRLETRQLPTASIGTQSKLLSGLQKGDIGVAVLTGSAAVKFAPLAKVLGLPFLFRDSRQLFGQLDGEVGKQLEATMLGKGVVVLGWYDGGTRSLYFHSKPPRNVAQLGGLKIRVPARQDLRTTVSQLGGEPETLAYDKINAAFDSGSIDGAENDLLSYEADLHYKHAPYFVQTNHAVQFEVLVASAAIWNQLSEPERKTMMDAGRASALADREMWAKRTVVAHARLEKAGVKFIEPHDNSVFLSRVSDLYTPLMNDPKTSSLLLKLMTFHN
jgi:TRAP-type C4-dicarboxylate transport system substrate-binding protein